MFFHTKIINISVLPKKIKTLCAQFKFLFYGVDTMLYSVHVKNVSYLRTKSRGIPYTCMTIVNKYWRSV